jgi:hypothetical protein
MNPSNKTHLIFDRASKTYYGENTASSTNVAGKLVMCLQKTKNRSMFVTLYKYQLKVD